MSEGPIAELALTLLEVTVEPLAAFVGPKRLAKWRGVRGWRAVGALWGLVIAVTISAWTFRAPIGERAPAAGWLLVLALAFGYIALVAVTGALLHEHLAAARSEGDGIRARKR